MKNPRDIEQLSAYLDGQLDSSDSTRLESRISSDPELASVLSDIRAARGILRKMPKRKAPRNFTLTRKMVGLKPPLPQSYSFFRFSTAIASILLLLTFAANSIPRMSFSASAPLAQEAYGIGGGGAAATEAPMATEPSVATEAPVAEEPAMELAAVPTESLPASDSARIGETPMAEVPMPKDPANASESQDQSQVQPEAVVSIQWQIILLVVILLSAIISFTMSQNAKKKWN